jgi:hypothetical protein
VNPPYGGQAEAFCQRAINEYASGNVEAGIILVNPVHDQDWQAPLFNFPVCFANARIQFISGDGTENKNPTNRNIFVYLGPDPKKFAQVFDPRIGFVMTRLNDVVEHGGAAVMNPPEPPAPARAYTDVGAGVQLSTARGVSNH